MLDVTTIATGSQRRSLGLDHWIDGTMGVHRRGGVTTAIAPNGPELAIHVTRHHDLAGGLLSGLTTPRSGIEGLPPDVDHASGGPLHYDTGTGLLVLTYHGERFRDGDPTDYHSFVGMAVSYDEGVTFQDLGPVVVPEAVVAGVPGSVDVGPGAVVVRDGWFDVYYQDRHSTGCRVNLSMARSELSSAMERISSGEAPRFRKWDGKGFSGAGIGGPDIELIAPELSRLYWFDLVEFSEHGLVGMVGSTVCRSPDGDAWWWRNVLLVSNDGIDWSTPLPLMDSAVPEELIYVSIESGGDDPRRSLDGRFDLYRTRASTAFRWDDAVVERIRLHLKVVNPPGEASLFGHG